MTDANGNMVMPVAPYGGGSGFGGFGGDNAWWIIILLIFMGGWGNNGWNGNGNCGGGTTFVANDVQRGFDHASVSNGISGLQNTVTTGFGNVQTALCNGFAGVNAGVANGFAQAEIANNARQIADMNQMFTFQTGLANQLNGMAMAQQNCCCENRAAVADLKYNVATEACADRNAIATALRDVLEANNASTQRILDTMCQDKIDAKNEKIAELQNQLTMANLAASQNAQTAAILANNEAQTSALEAYLAPVPRPAYVVPYPYWCGCNNGTNGGTTTAHA